MSATTPSVGRILHYIPRNDGHALNYDPSQPLAVQIVYVCANGRVNIVGHDHEGQKFVRLNVPIITGDAKESDRGYCQWMPYQVQVSKGEIAAGKHA